MKRLLLFAVLALPLAAQQRFSASTGNASLNTAATGVTVQQPSVAANPAAATITLESATVYCSVPCVITQSQNATTPATATAATIVPISPITVASTSTAWTATNASGGTTVPPVINVPAGTTVPIDLSKITIPKGSASANYTVAIAAITGTANITITWRENQ